MDSSTEDVLDHLSDSKLNSLFVTMEKKKPYTEFERQLLVKLVQSNISELITRKVDAVSLRRKQEAWDNLANEFNSNPNISQTTTSKQLKKMWQNLKTKAKSIEGQRYKSTGVLTPSDIDPVESETFGTIPNIIPASKVDVVYLEGYEEDDEDSKSWHQKNHFDDKSSLTTAFNNSKRKIEENEETFEDIKKKIYLRELKHITEKFELEKKLLLEKHRAEMEILEIKKQLALKELNK